MRLHFRQASGFEDFKDLEILARRFEQVREASQALGYALVMSSRSRGGLVGQAPL